MNNDATIEAMLSELKGSGKVKVRSELAGEFWILRNTSRALPGYAPSNDGILPVKGWSGQRKRQHLEFQLMHQDTLWAWLASLEWIAS